MTTSPHSNSHNERLKQAFSVTEDDLVANRAGQLTPPQQGQLRRKRVLYTLGMLAGIVLCLVLGVSGIVRGSQERSSRYNPYMGGWGLLCLSIPVLLFGLYTVRQVSQDASNNQVDKVQGMISRRVQRRGFTKRYRVVSQGTGFEINGAQYKAFVDGERYTLYYTPLSRILIAAEPLSSPPA